MFLLLALACDPTDPAEGIVNPTGDCEPDGDGGRPCYHAPAAGEVWLPDCELELAREYWRVFAIDADTAYMIPRPDGAADLPELCASDDADLVAILDAYTLCETSPDVDRVNAMDPADALTIAHALHARFAFANVEVATDSWAVRPAPLDTDLVDICLVNTDPVLEADCEVILESKDADSCLDIGFLWDEATGNAVAAALNTLYGVE